MNLEDIHRQQQQSIDALILALREHLGPIVLRSQSSILASLQKRLAITDGVIDRTAANNRILRSLYSLIVAEMDRQGYGTLVRSFVSQFPGQLPYVGEILNAIGEQAKTKLPKWVPGVIDKSVLTGLQSNAVVLLTDVVEQAARTATQNLMFSLGGMTFSDLSNSIADKLAITVPRAETLADTALNTWYRTAQDRSFQFIEKDLPSVEMRYKYTSGPDDKKTRLFCHRMIEKTKAGHTWTRAEIAAMDNGQLANVMITCGGYNCRHQWLVAFDKPNKKAS